MNKEYVYKDGKALVIDADNNQKVVDYYDKLGEVLVQEDLIEVMESEIEELEGEVSSFKKPSKFSKLLNWLPIAMGLGTPIVSVVLCKMFNVDMSFGVMLGVVLCPFNTFLGGGLTYFFSHNDKEIEQRENAKRVQLEYIKKEMVVQQEYLEDLKKDKTNSRGADDFSMSVVDSTTTLKDLRNFLSFYYHLGYNEKEYLKYYQEGTLGEHLEGFNEVGVQAVTEHFEEKGPTLSYRPK